MPTSLNEARIKKNDEFYTQLTDVAKELIHYKAHFKDKVVLCNCDDPTWSAFWKYFHLNFAELGLKKLISTHYDREEATYKMEYTGGDDNDIGVGVKTPLKGDGDFRNQECLDLLDECDMVVTNPPFSCYSSNTEVMTNHGWKFINDVNIDEDVIMSLNPENKHIEMIEAVDFISSPVNGELYHFHNQNMDFCVTGNHQMYTYYKDVHSDNKPIPFINAENVKKSHLLPLKGFSWIGNQEEYFYIPETVQLEQYSRKKIIVPQKEIPMKDWLEFFGFWLADGCCRDHINTCGKRDYTISIKQNVKNEQYVLDLIHRIGFIATISRRSDGNNNYNIYSKQLWEYLYQFGRSADKYIPREFLELDSDLLKCLFQGYLNGDGSKCADGHYHLSSVSKSLMDNIQEIILKIYGITTQVRTTKRKHSYNNEFGICYSINVLFDRRTEFSKYGVPDKIPYNDNVYCLTLKKNHIMLVRHNGIIGWCGNCFREYVAVLMEHNKQFLVLGNINAITYKDIFKLVMENKIWLGNRPLNKDMYFNVPDDVKEYFLKEKKEGSAYVIKNNQVLGRLASVCWYTNVSRPNNKKLKLECKYSPDKYQKYDGYDVINVDRVKDIPHDYTGVMGVPITYLGVHNPLDYDILGVINWNRWIGYECYAIVNGKHKYQRLIIKKRPAP